MTPDELLGGHDESVRLRTHLLDADPAGGSPTVVIQGSRAALRLLGELLTTVADVASLPYDIHVDPRGPGSFHFDPASSLGIYIECTGG